MFSAPLRVQPGSPPLGSAAIYKLFQLVRILAVPHPEARVCANTDLYPGSVSAFQRIPAIMVDFLQPSPAAIRRACALLSISTRGNACIG